MAVSEQELLGRHFSLLVIHRHVILETVGRLVAPLTLGAVVGLGVDGVFIYDVPLQTRIGTEGPAALETYIAGRLAVGGTKGGGGTSGPYSCVSPLFSEGHEVLVQVCMLQV